MINVGTKIKALREQKGYTQEQVADHLNISQPTYARIESGERNSWANYLEPLCTFFEVQPEDLVKQEGISISHNRDNSTNAFIINQLSEKLIEQYELRLKEKDLYIANLQERLGKYE
ncbi:MAG: hypothetical protein Tsb0033_02150 [Winogradskyella sp.]